MSIREQIAALEELAAIDVDVRRIDEELASQRSSLEILRTESKELETRAGADRERLSEMEKTRNELHLELRQMGQQVDRSREKLQRSRNERESNAAQREMEELRKLRRDREVEINKLGDLCELARSSITETQNKLDELTAALAGSSDGVTQRLTELEGEKLTQGDARKRVQATLPPALYRRYESIRSRRPFAIAKTYDGICQGCHIRVPPMMFQKMLRQEEFEQCPNCRRILYYVPAPPSSEASDEPR